MFMTGIGHNSYAKIHSLYNALTDNFKIWINILP